MGHRFTTALLLQVLLVGCGAGGPKTATHGTSEIRNSSESMAPTYRVGDRLEVDTSAGGYRRGDVVIFHPPVGANDDACAVNHSDLSACPRPKGPALAEVFVKRVVAKGGDEIEIRRGRVLLKKPGDSGFRLQREPFIRPSSDCDICNLTQPIAIPNGYYFMMGDNRGSSDDSRKWGPVRKAWILGKVIGTKSR